jgi:cyclic pyranopterin phosphate synthase
VAELTHFDESGASRIVDTSDKAETARLARASAQVRLQVETMQQLQAKTLSKGDVLEVARLAGIMAAKKTSDLIPLCHPLPISSVKIDFAFESETMLRIDATVKVVGRTGVEMEALTAAAVAALTVYDMCKSLDKGIVIERLRLEEKHGGKSGTYQVTD